MPVKPSLAFLGLRCRLLRWRLRRLGRFGRLGRLRCRLLQALLHWLRLSGLGLLACCRLLPIPIALLLGRDLVRALLLSLLPYLPFNLLALLPLLLLHSTFFPNKRELERAPAWLFELSRLQLWLGLREWRPHPS